MKPAFNPAPDLMLFIAAAQLAAKQSGVQAENVLLLWLAIAAAMAGDLTTSTPSGDLETVKSKFSLLVVTDDSSVPSWVADFFDALFLRQEEVLKPRKDHLTDPEAKEKFESRIRVMKALGHGEATLLGRPVPDPDLRHLDHQLRLVSNLPGYRHLHRLRGGGRPPEPFNGLTCTLAALGHAELRKILRTRHLPSGLATSISHSTQMRSNVVGWISCADWPQFAHSAGPECLRNFGWLIQESRTGTANSRDLARFQIIYLQKNLEIMRLGGLPLQFQPHDTARDFLNRQMAETDNLLSQLPLNQRDLAIPDHHLGWHLASLLLAIAADTPYPKITMELCCKLGSFLASRTIRHHIHRFRHTFPADGHGPFTGLDLRTLRFLTQQPQSVRDIQRRLSDATKARCLVALHRACDAGFARALDDEHFAAAPPPPGLGLSEFVSGMPADEAFPLGTRQQVH